MSLTRVGGDLLKQPLNIGTGVTITPDGNATFSGIVTAANLVGSDGKPIASGAGLGTAVVAGSDEGGEQIYYTNTVLNITDNLTIDPPDSANTSYTQYQEVAVEQGKDLIVEDDFIVDVLGISSSVVTPLPGQGGRVRADRFTNKAGTGAPEFPNGVTISAGSTVTGDFGVSGDLLVGNDLTVSGSKTYLNTNSVEFKDKNIGIASVSTGKLTDGQLNGAGFTIYGLNGDKSLTWDNPNDRMAFSTDLYAPRIYADSVTADDSITVGDKFINSSGVGLGTTSTAGRNAGIGTAEGTIIYNSSLKEVQVYKGELGWTNIAAGIIEATGGIVNEYTEGSTVYRAHIFTSSGTLNITSASGPNLTVETLVVAGGGGGGSYPLNGAGSGGAGGLLEGTFNVSSTPGSYTITVGAGGAAGHTGNGSNGDSTTIANPNIPTIAANGGGGGSGGDSYGLSGGSGGGAGGNNLTNAAATQIPYSSTLIGYGNQGGTASPGGAGGGGGGAIGAGLDGPSTLPRSGPGRSNSYTGTLSTYAVGGSPGPFTPGVNLDSAAASTGNGGDGKGNPGIGGAGGSGIVVVRYAIGSLGGTAKATGGYVSFSGGKTIHQFTSSGTFSITDSSLTSVDYLVVAGGGAGGGGSNVDTGGGGGAGGFRTGTGLPVSNASPYTVTVGGGGATSAVLNTTSGPGGDSTFSTITSVGGGGGGIRANGAPGGSGGGGGRWGATGASGTAGQGNAGGDGAPSDGTANRGAGGGGGAGSSGDNAPSPDVGGNGGDGLLSSISGAPAYYAGGGAGGSSSPSTRATGGSGGGGNGGIPSDNDGHTATENTGGGGGGSYCPQGNARRGGAGGSGIVIISYPT